MDLPAELLEMLQAACLELQELGEKGRGVIAKRDFRCGEIILRENGFHGKTMENLATVVLASQTAREATSHLYAGPLHHLQQGFDMGALPEGATEDWMEVYAKVRFNCFQLQGSCLLPCIGLVNHACRPNVTVMRMAPVEECKAALVVVDKEGIAAGQEVLICYDSTLMFAPVQERRQHTMSTWQFLCKCARCESEEDFASDCAENHREFEDEELVSCREEDLSNPQIFRSRKELLHHPGMPFQLRKQMFHAQLAAGCTLLPHLHPALVDIYEEVQDLCASSEHRDHCEKVCKFYKELQTEGNSIWPRD